jgi:glycosyltransferase involved in cell wall biosynthesis
MRILVLTHLYPPYLGGGTDARCEVVTNALRERGHSVRVLTSNHGLSSEQRDAEIQRRLILTDFLDHAPAEGYRALRRIEAANQEVLRENLDEFRPALVHVWSMQGLGKSLLLALRESRLPLVFDVADRWLADELRTDPWLAWWNREHVPFVNGFARGVLELTGQRERIDQIAPTRLYTWGRRLKDLYQSPDIPANAETPVVRSLIFERCYFTSQALKTATRAAGFAVDHGEIIYPGIPAERYAQPIRPQSAELKRFLIVAPLSLEHGILTALEALRLLKVAKIPATLGVYGSGSSEFMAQMRSFVVKHQLAVEFLAASTMDRGAAAIYGQYDAFLHTSEWDEPQLQAPLEAMASGLPVVASTAGVAAEIFRHGETALTYTPGNPAELAQRIQELTLQPALRAQMAENAQNEAMTTFHEHRMVDRIEQYLAASLEAQTGLQSEATPT